MCRRITKFFAVGFALLMAALGLTVMSCGLYVLTKFDDLSYLGFSRNAVNVIIGTGAGLAVTSVAGACAAKKHIRFLLVAYLVVIFALITTETIAGVVVYKYDKADHLMENVECLYLTCCQHNRPAPTDATCTSNRWAHDDAAAIDKLCGKLHDATGVGLSTQPSCRAAAAFDDALRAWLDGELNTLGLVAGVTGGVELLGALAVCALLRLGAGGDGGDGATDELGYTSLELAAEQRARRARVEERKQFYRDKYALRGGGGGGGGRGRGQPGIDNAGDYDHTPAFAQYLDRKAEQDADRIGSPGRVTGAAARAVVARGSFSAAADEEEVNPMYSSKGSNFLTVV